MTNVLLLAARRTAAALFPSVPLKDRALILAAMQDPHTPATGREGEATLAAGHGPVGGVDSPVLAPPTGPRTSRAEVAR